MARPAHDPLFYPPPTHPTDAASTAAANGSASSNRWGPYHDAGDFSATMGLVLLILVCTLAFVLAFTATVRFFLRCRRGRSPAPPAAADPEKQERAGKDAAPETTPTLTFTAGMELAGAAECAICLAEFAEGEGVRVLPACNHGFHVKCVEAWLASKPSCPTCRCSCQVASAGPPGKPQPSRSERV